MFEKYHLTFFNICRITGYMYSLEFFQETHLFVVCRLTLQRLTENSPDNTIQIGTRYAHEYCTCLFSSLHIANTVYTFVCNKSANWKLVGLLSLTVPLELYAVGTLFPGKSTLASQLRCETEPAISQHLLIS